MPLTPEQEWTLVGCGMIAHADDVLEVGEWDQIVTITDATLDAEENQTWLDLLCDRGALEKKFADLRPPLPHFHKELLEQCWRMALADGSGSEVEAAVHDRIADKIGVEGDSAAEWRADWTEIAEARAEIVVGFAAALANIDGRMDTAEAAEFDSLLERMPVSVGRRVEMQSLLYSPPDARTLGERLVKLGLGAREAVFRDIGPLVKASHRGDKERELYFELAAKAAVPRAKAERILEL